MAFSWLVTQSTRRSQLSQSASCWQI